MCQRAIPLIIDLSVAPFKEGNIHNSGPFMAELKGYFILEWLVSGYSYSTLQSALPTEGSFAKVMQWCY